MGFRARAGVCGSWLRDILVRRRLRFMALSLSSNCVILETRVIVVNRWHRIQEYSTLLVFELKGIDYVPGLWNQSDLA